MNRAHVLSFIEVNAGIISLEYDVWLYDINGGHTSYAGYCVPEAREMCCGEVG